MCSISESNRIYSSLEGWRTTTYAYTAFLFLYLPHSVHPMGVEPILFLIKSQVQGHILLRVYMFSK